jgi:glycine/D-amino acid oxidase-like deaminating enzyme
VRADTAGGVGWWMREALAAEPDRAAPLSAPFESDTYDVAIVGGGYTGLWTAWSLLQAQPGARIVLIEQGICGGGPSGRNGGFVHGWWDQLPYLIERFGPESALQLAHLVDEGVGAIGGWCEGQGVDAWFRHGGYLRVSASAAQDGEWLAPGRASAELGVAGEAQRAWTSSGLSS